MLPPNAMPTCETCGKLAPSINDKKECQPCAWNREDETPTTPELISRHLEPSDDQENPYANMPESLNEPVSKTDLANQIINTLLKFPFTRDQLVRINEIINE